MGGEWNVDKEVFLEELTSKRRARRSWAEQVGPDGAPRACAEAPGGASRASEEDRMVVRGVHRAVAEPPKGSFPSRLVGQREPVKGFRLRPGMVQWALGRSVGALRRSTGPAGRG